MKKILLLLVSVLFTLSSFGQSSIDYSPVNTVTQVGDTLIMKFQYFKGDGGDLTLGQFDFEYNNKLLSYISHTSQAPSGASFARNNWGGYKYIPNPDADADASAKEDDDIALATPDDTKIDIALATLPAVIKI